MFPAPNILIKVGPFLQWINWLVREIQKKISATYVHNTSGVTIARGLIVSYVQGDREVALCDCTAATGTVKTARAIGVLVEDTPTTKWGVMRTDDLTYVLFVAGLNPEPVAGDPVYVSPVTPGYATNVLPVGVGDWITKIGTVADGTTYATLGACKIEQKYCCEPEEVLPL